MIIGITGTLGSGKGTVVELLKEKGFTHHSVSGNLTLILDERGLPATRENLSALADELVNKYVGGALEYINRKAEANDEKNFILESIHRVKEADYIRSIGGIILGVDAEPRVRFERTVKRKEGEKDNVTFEQFLADIEREEEGKGKGTPNIRAVIESADFVIDNNGTVEELSQKVEAFLQAFEPSEVEENTN